MTTTRPMRPEDWPDVARAYAAGIEAGHATFESRVPTWEEFDASRLPDHRIVAVDEAPEADGGVVGWAAVSPTSRREVYAGVVEHSVYVDPAAQGHGVGRVLLQALLASTDAAGIWTVQSAIFPENVASLHLHEQLGFRVVGRRERIARATVGPFAGRWRDTVLVERRVADEVRP